MSVLIEGMEMPKYGDIFKVYLDAADNVLLVDTSDSSRFYTLVEIPLHGRLIDADAFLDGLLIPNKQLKQGVRELVMDAPTIIPAEKDE